MPFSPELPDPPVPADCDLRGLPYYPLNLQRLVRSTFHNQASPAEWKAGLLLWMKSWDQTPSGSLPNNDRELSSLAELRDVRAWLKLKGVSLHGWELHSDGRYYHPVVTEVTLHAWKLRKVNRRRGTAGAEARWTPMRQASPENAPSMRDGCVADGKLKEEVEVPSPHNPEANASVLLAPLPNQALRPPPRGSRLTQEICLSEDWRAAAEAARTRANMPAIDLATEFEKFSNYWLAKSGKNATKIDWRRTWVNWALNANPPRNGNGTPLANLFEGAWRAANELNEQERREQGGDFSPDSSPPQPLLDRC